MMFYSNPFNQNCAVFLSETKVFNADSLLSNETVTMSCASLYATKNIEIYQQTKQHPNPYNNPNIAQTCQGYNYPDNPGSAIRNCGVRYFVDFDGQSIKGTAELSGDNLTGIVGTGVWYARQHEEGITPMPKRSFLATAIEDNFDNIVKRITQGIQSAIDEGIK